MKPLMDFDANKSAYCSVPVALTIFIALVMGNGSCNIALTTTSSTAFRLARRELLQTRRNR